MKTKETELAAKDIASLSPAEFDRVRRFQRLNAKRVGRTKKWFDMRRD